MLEPLPGAAPIPDVLRQRLEAAARGRAGREPPRTHHLEGGLPRFTNRLALERSPYLRQHAHNPVSWWPWGPEALEEARRTGRPIFLSVGYATCHWCHVMERESFEDLEIAAVLNADYVPVKVDREERPDVDALYMTAVQLLTGQGGWPMSVWLTPAGEPFFAGTYFPARDGDRGPTRGFLSILREIAALWAADPERVRRATGSLVEAVQAALAPPPLATGPERPGPEVIEAAVARLGRIFDERHGGVRGAPKFPSSMPVRLLLRHHRRARDARSLELATVTLERMAAGGLMDQLGGGFHRYSTDERWLVPHFEKMLYDNALLAIAYAEAYQVTGRRDFARVVRQTLDYLLRELAAPEGAFYAASDADSEGEEGKYFVWTLDELSQVLGDEAGELAAFHGVTAAGNFEGGASVLHVPAPDEDRWERLAPARARLLAARAGRVPPLTDEKVLAGWNGLAISALAQGGRILGEPRWIEAAARAARFVLERMVVAGRLQRSFGEGHAGVPAFLEDHAFLAQGLLDLHEATFEPRWLEEAAALFERAEALFGDPAAGGWFQTATDHERLLAREKPSHDGAEPSGASVMTLVALRLEAFTAEDRYRAIADRALALHARALAEQPLALTELLLAVDFATDSPQEVVLVWPEAGPPPEPFLDVLRRTFLPSRALTGAAAGDGIARLARTARVAEGKAAAGGPTAYVCERGRCRLPAIAPEKLAAQLAPVRPYR
ncbi:MAG: thioredoxin domain-containing protein [Anaeromyxobacteraceae bacterium]